jgi:mannose-6-phosphate isomerase-like protein (cupin superfamily)
MTEHELQGAHVAPGEGEALWIGGECLAFKLPGADTAGAVALLEDTVQPGYGPPPHIHLHENEVFYVLSGEFTFTVDDQTIAAPVGTVATVPRGVLHTFQNVGAEPGKLLAVVWPAVAFEAFVSEVGTPEPPAGPPDIEKLLQAAARHGIAVPPVVET